MEFLNLTALPALVEIETNLFFMSKILMCLYPWIPYNTEINNFN